MSNKINPDLDSKEARENKTDYSDQIQEHTGTVFGSFTVTASQIENFISKESGIDLSKVFDQYLRTTKVPLLEYRQDNAKLSYRWTNCIEGFNMPVKIYVNDKESWIKPAGEWKMLEIKEGSEIKVDRNFYIQVKKA